MDFLFFIAPGNFRDEELLEPKEVLENAGIKTRIASTVKKEAVGKLGARIQIDFALEDIETSNYSGIAFVGGPGVVEHKLYENPRVLFLARKFNKENRIVSAICVAPRILAKAGVLQGKNATAFPDEETIAMLKEAGARYTGSGVEMDGRVITANGPGAAKKFGEALVHFLK